MTHKIIFINGPPHSGKDQASYILKRLYGVRTYKMSRPLKDALSAFFLIDHFTLRDEVEPNKDKKLPEFGNLSWREMQISLSEGWAKRVFGPDVLGQCAVRFLRQGTSFDMTVIECGFYRECVPIVKHVGSDNCLLIQLSRKECTFEDDSRSYIELSNLGVTTIELDNRYPLNPTADMPLTYEMQLQSAVNGWLGVGDDT